MRISEELNVLYQVLSDAEKIAEKLNISWDLYDNTFSNMYFLRNCSFSNIIVPAYTSRIINTGIRIQITDPYYRLIVKNYSNIIKNKHIGILNNLFDYDYRDEIQLIAYNYSDIDTTIVPGEIVTCIYFDKVTVTNISKVDRVQPGEKYPGTRDNNWVLEDKKIQKHLDNINKSYKDDINIQPENEHSINRIIESRLK